MLGLKEQDSVVVAQHKVVARDSYPIDYGSRHHPAANGNASRAKGRCAEAMELQANLRQLQRVPMQPPDDHSTEPGESRFQHEQIPNARLVRAAPVVNHENTSARSRVDRFKDHIDTPDMSDRPGGAREPHSGQQWVKRHRDLVTPQCRGELQHPRRPQLWVGWCRNATWSS